MIYLDSAATTLQKPPTVARAVSNAIRTLSSPGRGGHPSAARAADLMFRCRSMAAEMFEVESPEQVVFTSNATHGLNIAIHSLVRPGSVVLTTGYEHNAVTRPLEFLAGTVKVASSPLFSPDALAEAFDRQLTREVSCAVFTHVSNVFGYILPVERLAALCRERGVPFIVDASQSAGCLPVSMREWGADFIAMPGHKGLYGPQGTGLLLCGRAGEPLLRGGTGSLSLRQDMPDFLPDRLEAGTHNVCGTAGLLEGIRYVRARGIHAIREKEHRLCRRTAVALARLPGVTVYATEDPALQSGVVSFRVDGMDCEELGERLSRRGIAVRAGFHCAPYAHRSGGTLETGTVRVSFSDFNTEDDVRKLIWAVKAEMAKGV